MSRTLRRVAATIGAAATASLVLVSVPSAPASALAAGWTLTIDDHPEVVDSKAVAVTGRVDVPLGGVLGVFDRPGPVTVKIVPAFSGAPAACTTSAMTKTVNPSSGRYRVDQLTAACNGPHRIEVTSTSQEGARSGDPVTEALKVADGGAAPQAPRAVGSTNGILLTWTPTASPDVVGWSVTGGLAPTRYDAATTSATVPAAPGARRLDLVARRWGADGPGGGELASPGSTSASVTVTAPRTTLPTEPAPAPPAASPPRTGGGGSGANVPAPGRTTTPSRSGATVPARRPPTGTPEGYREDLPYGAPDEAFVPGDDPAARAGSGEGDDERAGTSPSASVVRTRDTTSPGLVAPFALAILMVTIATHIAWYLRRSRPSPGPQQGSGA